jgi:1,4-dihydroxy-2-naphthoate octaprenyltransferase
MPIKLVRLWIGDDYNDINFHEDHARHIHSNRTNRIIEILGYSIGYYIVFIFALIGVYIRRKNLLNTDGLLLIPLIGACCIHMLMYGGMRYHYPYMPILIYFAAWGIYQLYQYKFAKYHKGI